MVLAYAAQFVGSEDVAELPAEPPSPETPGFHVLTLNATSRTDVSPETFYTFPYDETFYTMFEQYGGAVVLLIRNCSGPDYTMTFNAGESLLIDSIAYHGQALIAFGGWSGNGVWGWMENATMYWRDGLWEPTDGILVDRGDVVLGQAELSVLYIVPQAIPEFTDIGLVVGLMMMVVIVIRRRVRG